MVEIRHIDRRLVPSNLQEALHRQGVPYGILGSLTETGLIGDYLNFTSIPVAMGVEDAREIGTEISFTRLRAALRESPTYTQYLLNRFPLQPHGNKFRRARNEIVLSLLTSVPNAPALKEIITTFHTMAEEELSPEALEKIQKLSNKAYLLTWGEKRTRLAGIPIEND